ncbi:hypothetical protein ACQKGI_03545 [Peribacillus muralis]|uniref:hypothetical protein n=1 Tax=Peribacillus muralis TaxID=264697 RepID=UPI0037F3E458
MYSSKFFGLQREKRNEKAALDNIQRLVLFECDAIDIAKKEQEPLLGVNGL